MNTCTVVGRVHKWPADMRTIQGSGTRFMTCIIAYEKKFPSGKRFTEKFKVMMFGKNAESICGLLKPGTLVVAAGEVGIEKPAEGSKQREPMLKLTGTISLLECGEPDGDEEQQRQPRTRSAKPTAQVSQEDDDDIPF